MSEQRQQTAPPYSEKQVIRWLAFLARGMTEHDQSIFLMEKLQPSWLLARWQRWIYVLASRLIWGILCGLIFGLILNLRDLLVMGVYNGKVLERSQSEGLDSYQFVYSTLYESVYSFVSGHSIEGVIEWLIVGLICGLVFGLVFGLSDGLIDVSRTSSKHMQVAQHSPESSLGSVWRSAIAGLSVALIIDFLLDGRDLFAGLAIGLIGLNTGFVVWLSLWLVGVIRTRSRRSRSEVDKPPLRQVVRESVLIGSVVGLMVGLMSVLIFDDLVFGLILGSIWWLVVGLSLTLSSWLPSKLRVSSPMQLVWGTVLIGLILRVTVRLLDDVHLGLIFGLIPGLIFGPIWFLRAPLRIRKAEIETVETIRFLRNTFQTGFRYGLIVGMLVGLIFWWDMWTSITYLEGMFLFGGYETWDIDKMQLLLDIELRLALIFGIIVGTVRSFKPVIRELKTSPNQGIWLSLRSARLMGSVGGLVLSVLVGGGMMLGVLADRISVMLGIGMMFGPSSGWIDALIYGLVGGLCIALWYGGLDVIQHFLVRFLLWRSGSLPWRLAPFLDYAAEELHFLQKVGGGYIFVHRYLLEHFAAMETDDGGPRTADGG